MYEKVSQQLQVCYLGFLVAVRHWLEILINGFLKKKGFGCWWIYLGWWWVVVGGGGYILAGGGWWWIYFDWWWVVVDGDGWWWLVAQFSLTHFLILSSFLVLWENVFHIVTYLFNLKRSAEVENSEKYTAESENPKCHKSKELPLFLLPDF